MKKTSDHFNGKIFLNPVPTEVMQEGSFGRVLKEYMKGHPDRTPQKPLGPFSTQLSQFSQPPSQDIRITWLGHSTLLFELEGKRFLTDPVWYQRVSPFKSIGPKRFFQNPIPFDQLPPIDYILLSHDHYDHLDKDMMLYLIDKKVPVITMLGVGERLVKWGAPQSLITELDWWDSIQLDHNITVTAAPARHFSGRWLGDRFATLWGSFAIKGPNKSVYFGADSGYFEGFPEIGKKLGPFDVVMLEIGAYNENWISIHMGPERAVQVSQELGGKFLLPIHWGTFNLALHPWKEPVERLIAEAEKKGVALLLPAPGQTITADKKMNSRWWEQYQ